MKVRHVGFFQELEHGDRTGPMLGALVGNTQVDEARIVNYLQNGLLLVGCPGVVSDVLDKTAGIIGSLSIMTDGAWAWPSDLPYYLEKYHVLLPEAFLEHVRSRNYKPITEEDVNIVNVEL